MLERIVSCNPLLIPEVQKALQYRLYFCAPEIVSFQVQPAAIRLTLSTDSEEVWAKVRQKVEKVLSGIRDGFVPPAERVVAERRNPAPSWSGIDVDLAAAGFIRESGQGRAILGPMMACLVERLDQIFLEMAASFNAKPIGTPALIPCEILSRIDYFRAFPHSLTFAYHLPADVDAIERFSESPLDAEGKISSCASNGADAVLSPAVCFHLYHFLEGQTLNQALDAYTMRGRCFRYESGALTGLERLWDFTMREIVFVGEKDAVMESRKQSIEWTTELADRLGLLYRVKTASDPFFVGEFRQRTIFQAAFDLKYEWQVDLDPARESAIAAGSFNVHQTHFGKAFSIRLPSGEMAWTGCMAFGLERLALAVIRQHGISVENWPDILKSDLPLTI